MGSDGEGSFEWQGPRIGVNVGCGNIGRGFGQAASGRFRPIAEIPAIGQVGQIRWSSERTG